MIDVCKPLVPLWNIVVGVLASFCRGLYAVLLGLQCILCQLDKEEAKRDAQLGKARNVIVAPKTQLPGSSVLRNRRKRRQELLLKESGVEASVSPQEKRESRIIKKLSLFKDAIKHTGIRLLSKNRYKLASCIVFNVLICVVFSLAASAFEECVVVGVALKALSYVIQFVFRFLSAEIFGQISSAVSAHRDTLGIPRRNFQQLTALNTKLSDILVSFVTIFLMDMQNAFVLPMFPIDALRPVVIFLGLCLYHASFAFDYRYMSEGLIQSARFRRIERNWPFYVGFGFLLAFFEFFYPDPIIARCVANACYPILIVGAYQVDPEIETNGIPAIPAFAIPLTVSEKLVKWFVKWIFSDFGTTRPTIQR